MKRRYTPAILLALLMLFTIMPASVWGMDKHIAEFDWEDTDWEYDYEDDYDYFGSYDGNPQFSFRTNGYFLDIIPNCANDKITVQIDNEEIVCHFERAYDEETGETSYNLYDKDGNEIDYLAWYIDQNEVGLELTRYDDESDYYEYDFLWQAFVRLRNVTISNDVEKIVFSPSTITLDSEKIKETDDGETYYNLGKRSLHSAGGEQWYSQFEIGDKLIVYYSNGQTKTFTNRVYYDELSGEWYEDFLCGDEWVYADMNPWYLEPGNNRVEVSHHGRTTMINVIVETPEARAAKARAAAAAQAQAIENARQGVYDPSLPKVKAKKPAAKKAKATVKWTKLKKKQLKKSKATNYEIWVCPNPGFARGETIERIVGKGKASLNVGGLQKNTKYFVKIRAIKYVNGVKHVGPWNHKTVKTKKK